MLMNKRKDMPLKDMEEMVRTIFMGSVDFSKPPSEKNMYISIQEGWSSNGEDKYWMFSAIIPSRGLLMTGRGGFLLFVQDWDNKMFMPIAYNGQPLPTEHFEDFLEYCKTEKNGKEEKKY